jgi:hypothetical protein
MEESAFFMSGRKQENIRAMLTNKKRACEIHARFLFKKTI